jgi:hypothetical protein
MKKVFVTKLAAIRYFIFSETNDMEDNFVRRKFIRKKKLPPAFVSSTAPLPVTRKPVTQHPVTQTISSNQQYIRKKVRRPFVPVNHFVPTTPLPPVVIEDQSALNRSQDDPRCK